MDNLERIEELKAQITAIEHHNDAVNDVILMHDWEPAKYQEWEDLRRCCSELLDILHRARWACMWALVEEYKEYYPGVTKSDAD